MNGPVLPPRPSTESPGQLSWPFLSFDGNSILSSSANWLSGLDFVLLISSLDRRVEYTVLGCTIFSQNEYIAGAQLTITVPNNSANLVLSQHLDFNHIVIERVNRGFS